ncbi:MAG: hypothetical protein KF878_09840 [Planctomycetes bacterium]|nr:hypothetical protein [Planctomycetota bacterium]
MAAPNVNASYLVSGRLARGVTDLSAAFPHGGTELGLVGSARLVWAQQYVPLVAEETNAPAAVLFVGGQVSFGCFMESWDPDALAAFPSTTLSSGDRRIDIPGSTLPGTVVTPWTNLLFSPNNPEHPALLLFRAVPMVETAQEINLSAYRPLSVSLAFLGLPDDTDRVAQFGRRALLGPLA